jgi:hypothetical protein
MGFNGNWVAVKGIGIDILEREIGLIRQSSEPLEEASDAPYWVGMLPTGWSICVLGHFDERVHDPLLLQKLSAATDLIMGQALESTMCSELSMWSGGKRQWLVYHYAAEGDSNHLEFEGINLPSSLEGHRQFALAAHAKDSSVDFMFDVPLILSQEIAGFRYDQPLPDGAEKYEVELIEVEKQASATSSRKPWWKFW